MKTIAALFFLALAGSIAAQQAVTPTNRIELFNGTNFDGFKFCMKNDADPMKTWSVTNGAIHCNGSAIGYLRTEQSYNNYVLYVGWRFLKIAPKADNTGVLVHMQLPDKVWPMCIQIQGKHDRQGDLFLMGGAESKEHMGMDANTAIPMRSESAEYSVGTLNTSETICNGNDVKVYINDKLMNETTECTDTNGFVGIQSEGADFEIRKMYLEPSTNPDEFFKVITDAQTGEYAVVNSDKTTVSLKDKNGNVIWATDVAREIKSDPYLSDGKIIYMQLSNNFLSVELGRGAVTLDKRTGKIMIIIHD